MSAYNLLSSIWHHTNFWSLAVLAIFLLFLFVLYRLDQSEATDFQFFQFFTSGDWDGKASIARLSYFGAFLTHSLVLLHQQMAKGGVDYAMASLYALIWSGAYVALKAIELKGGPGPAPVDPPKPAPVAAVQPAAPQPLSLQEPTQ